MSVGVCPGRRSDRSWCEPLKDLIVKGEPQTLCLLKRLALTSGYVLRICSQWLLRWLLLIAKCYTESGTRPDLERQGQGRTQGRLLLPRCMRTAKQWRCAHCDGFLTGDTYQKCGGCAANFHNECIETHIENAPRGSPCRSAGAEEVHITNTSSAPSTRCDWMDTDTCPHCQWKIWDISAPQTCVMKRSHTDTFMLQDPTPRILKMHVS